MRKYRILVFIEFIGFYEIFIDKPVGSLRKCEALKQSIKWRIMQVQEFEVIEIFYPEIEGMAL